MAQNKEVPLSPHACLLLYTADLAGGSFLKDNNQKKKNPKQNHAACNNMNNAGKKVTNCLLSL